MLDKFKMDEQSKMVIEKLPPVLKKVAIDATPEKAVSNYFKSKFEGNLLVK